MSESSEPSLMEPLPATRDDLRAHADRGALILVAAELDLRLVSQAVASDASKCVQAWLEAAQLSRATFAELPESAYLMVIVQPFVLVQLAPS